MDSFDAALEDTCNVDPEVEATATRALSQDAPPSQGTAPSQGIAAIDELGATARQMSLEHSSYSWKRTVHFGLVEEMFEFYEYQIRLLKCQNAQLMETNFTLVQANDAFEREKERQEERRRHGRVTRKPPKDLPLEHFPKRVRLNSTDA